MAITTVLLSTDVCKGTPNTSVHLLGRRYFKRTHSIVTSLRVKAEPTRQLIATLFIEKKLRDLAIYISSRCAGCIGASRVFVL